MQTKRIALVTGANKGIGLQVARDLLANGLIVMLGTRDLEMGEAAAKSIGPNAHALHLDVTDSASIASAAERIRNEFGHLDVLVNNAGISHAGKIKGTFPESAQSGLLTVASLDDIRMVFETNVFGVIAVTQAMLPLLLAAPTARIVNVGSTGGSLGWNSDPTNSHRTIYGTYSASKTALHAITFGFAMALASTGIKVNVGCPGFTSTALNDFKGTRSVEEGSREIVRFALIANNGPTGSFSDEDGPVAW